MTRGNECIGNALGEENRKKWPKAGHGREFGLSLLWLDDSLCDILHICGFESYFNSEIVSVVV